MAWVHALLCMLHVHVHVHVAALYAVYYNSLLQVAVSKFHELRYNVAYVLKEMEDLEKRNILKLQD